MNKLNFLPEGLVVSDIIFIFAAVIIGLVSDLIHFINKVREDEHACKEEKNTQSSQNFKKSY